MMENIPRAVPYRTCRRGPAHAGPARPWGGACGACRSSGSRADVASASCWCCGCSTVFCSWYGAWCVRLPARRDGRPAGARAGNPLNGSSIYNRGAPGEQRGGAGGRAAGRGAGGERGADLRREWHHADGWHADGWWEWAALWRAPPEPHGNTVEQPQHQQEADATSAREPELRHAPHAPPQGRAGPAWAGPRRHVRYGTARGMFSIIPV
eukprot:gene13183-biopygen9513